jgi:hypothetical protein
MERCLGRNYCLGFQVGKSAEQETSLKPLSIMDSSYTFKCKHFRNTRHTAIFGVHMASTWLATPHREKIGIAEQQLLEESIL